MFSVVQVAGARSVALASDADWTLAVEKNLARQTLYNNVVKEVFNSLTRIIGWSLISVVSSWSWNIALNSLVGFGIGYYLG